MGALARSSLLLGGWLGGWLACRFALSRRQAPNLAVPMLIALGYGLFEGAPKAWLSLIQAFAGGAILVMLTNSMIPESYDHAGKLAGIFTVLGFFLSVSIAVLETAQVVACHG